MVAALLLMAAGCSTLSGSQSHTRSASAGEKAKIGPGWARRLTGYMTARDGTRLRYSVLLPKSMGPFPVIINYSGYDPGSIGGKAYLDNDVTMSATLTSAEAEGDVACEKQIGRNLAYIRANPLTTTILQHPFRDKFIQHWDVAARTSRINVPVLSMEAFQDEAVTSREGYYQETLDPSRLWILQTNGPHDAYESIRWRDTLVPFLEKFVGGKDNGFEKRPHVQVWMESHTSADSGHPFFENIVPGWTFERPSFPVHVTPIGFALSEGGKLTRASVGSGAKDSYKYPVPGPAVNANYYRNRTWGPLSADWREGSLAYTSEPLSSPIVAYGEASADLWISSMAPDTDLQVTLTEVRPDGQEVYVQRGWLRASDRAIDQKRSTAVRPVLLDRVDTLSALQPGKPVLARVELNKFAYAFRVGSRIRIWIDAPSDTGEYEFDAISIHATNSVWHNALYPSKLTIGTLDDVPIKNAQPRCGTMVRQPCRPDPLTAGLREQSFTR